MPEPKKLGMKDLLRNASKDKRVAAHLLKDPESFSKLYNLSPTQVKNLKDATAKIRPNLGPNLGKLAADINYE